MNPRTLLKEVESSKGRDALVDVVFDEFAEYCRENNITEDEISTPQLEQLAEGFVERGFGVSKSNETAIANEKYQSGERNE